MWQRVPVPLPFTEHRRFANLVVERIATVGRVAVIDAYGRPALVSCRERLFEVLARDHDIVGVYGAGARAADVLEDLQAAGL